MSEKQLTDSVGTELLFENDLIRVWLLDLAPYQTTEWHEHSCDYVFIVTQAGPVRCEYVDGSTEYQDDEAGAVSYRKRDLGHRLVNSGGGRYQNIVVELKETASLSD